MPQSIDFLGIRFDNLSTRDICRIIEKRPKHSKFEYIITPNSDHIVRLNYEDFGKEFESSYKNSFICVCDSKVVAGIARFLGLPMTVSCGSDLVVDMFEDFIEETDAITIIGGNENSKETLKKLFNIKNIFQHIPPMDMMKNQSSIDECVEFITKNPSRYIFIAVGSPQQELIAYRTKELGKATGTAFCIGASIDFITGKIRRAPLVFREHSLEWLFRLMLEPRRLWYRYLVRSPKIFLLAIKYRKNSGTYF